MQTPLQSVMANYRRSGWFKVAVVLQGASLIAWAFLTLAIRLKWIDAPAIITHEGMDRPNPMLETIRAGGILCALVFFAGFALHAIAFQKAAETWNRTRLRR